MEEYYDYSAGPPDTSGLSRTERLEVMRQYRRYKEQAKVWDFSQGPPDVSELEGEERLNVLRQYRHWKQSQDGAFGVPAESVLGIMPAGVQCTRRDDAPTPRLTTAQQASVATAPWLPEHAPAAEEPIPDEYAGVAEEDLSAAAGVKSGAHGSVYTYFERPLTARDAARVPPTARQEVPPSPEEVGWVVKDQAAAEHAGSNRDSQRIHQRNDPTRPQVDNEPTNHHRLQLIITRVCVCVCVCV